MTLSERLEEEMSELEGVVLSHFAKVHTHADAQLIPSWFIIDGEWRRNVVQSSFEDTEAKDMAASMVRQLCRSTDAVLCALMCESWMVSVDNDEYNGSNMLPPSQHPDRVEALHLVIETRVCRKIVFWEMHRRPDGTAYLGARTESTGQVGRFGDLIPLCDA